MKYAGFWRRFGAHVIDTTVLLFVMKGVEAAFGSSIFDSNWANFCAGMLCMAYFILLESSKMQATLGKFLCKLYVSNKRGERLGTGRETARYLAYMIPSLPFTVVSYMYTEHDIQYTSAIIVFIGAMAIASIGYFVFAITAVFSKEKAMVHDMISKTRVLKGRAGVV